MPSLPGLEGFPYVEQEEGSRTCVVDCLDMVCQYWGIDKDWDEIAVEVGFSTITGVDFDNVAQLSGVITVWMNSVEAVETELSYPSPRPVIAHIVVEDQQVLSYAEREDLHAVVVVSCDEAEVVFVDPLSKAKLGTVAPSRCWREAFERAWLGGWALIPRSR
jgi:ABC-type bacteriocin/lantibiotic exporter with double-glycine peptidase domain